MSRVPARPLVAAASLFLLAGLVAVALLRAGGAGAAPTGELSAQPSFGAPAETFLGASPAEAAAEVWATSRSQPTLVHYTPATGWEALPRPVGTEGQGLSEIELASGSGAGRTTPGGGVVVAATVETHPTLIVRDPGGTAHAVVEPEAALEPSEELFTTSAAGPLLAATEAAGAVGAYVVPSRSAAILSYTAGNWRREPICTAETAVPACSPAPGGFKVLGIDAAGGTGWLLAEGAEGGTAVSLFRQEPNGGIANTPTWRQVPLGPPGSRGALFGEEESQGVRVRPRGDSQPLTATPAGAWIDLQLAGEAGTYDATVYFDAAAGEVTGTWCDQPTPAGFCQYELGAELPGGQNRSFAWPPSEGNPYGRRVVTGVGQGALLVLGGTAFARYSVAGGDAGTSRGAALFAPEEGWLGAQPALQLTRNPEPSQLQSWPVPFRRPLTALAGAPVAAVAGLDSEAIAVGANGEVARYLPGQGWEPEPLLTGSGKRATPTLRGVAWPEPERAYAVGGEASMWLWQKSTGLWSPDPGEPTGLSGVNFTGVAFDSANPNRGYAVGKQGVILAYGREWTQEPVAAGVPPEANFTSVAFAGSEAIATWKLPYDRNGAGAYEGGVISNSGSGWVVDTAAEEKLGTAVPQMVSGLPDGGAVIATAGEGPGAEGPWMIEREGPGAPWQTTPGEALGYPTALAALREGGLVRAVVAVAVGQQDRDLGTDLEQVFNQPTAEQPPLLTDPYPLPGSGIVARQTATGWRDEEHEGFPLPAEEPEQTTYDLGRRPDWVLAMLLDPASGEGWTVGGETGTFVGFKGDAVQTAGIERFGPSAAPPANAGAAPIATEPGTATFALGGNAQCAGPCADLVGTGIGPDRWLNSAVGKAAGIGGVRAFLYTGASVAEGVDATLDPEAFGREELAYSHRLGVASGGLPVFSATAPSDIDAAGSLETWRAAFAGFGAPLGSAAPGNGISPVSATAPGAGYYSFDSQSIGSGGGTVRVIVLDYSGTALGATQQCWLAGQLASAGGAGVPSIVVGGRDLAGQTIGSAADAGEVVPILVGAATPTGCTGGAEPHAASAYFFDFPEENRFYSLTAAGRSIPAFGSGTLGYVNPPLAKETDFVGASGFLLVSVGAPGAGAVAPVTARLIPNIGSLAMEATDGTLLRRSRVALFDALARRPPAGSKCTGNNAPSTCESLVPDPYVKIPSECQGARCATGLFPDYTFTSSQPTIANFVAHDPSSSNPRNIQLVNQKPVADPRSGLLCTFNAGTTVVTVSSGGLSYSQKVTVLGGTAQQPCGTTPLNEQVAATELPTTPPPPPTEPPIEGGSQPTPPPPPPGPGPTPVTTTPVNQVPTATPTAPPPPVPTQPPPPPPPPPPVPVPVPFLVPQQTPSSPVTIVPPPPPPIVQPTPPTGTSPVSQSVDAPEEDEEDEVAVEVQHMLALAGARPRGLTTAAAASVGAGIGSPAPLLLIPALMLLGAAGLATSIHSRRPGGRRRPQIAYQSSEVPRRRLR